MEAHLHAMKACRTPAGLVGRRNCPVLPAVPPSLPRMHLGHRRAAAATSQNTLCSAAMRCGAATARARCVQVAAAATQPIAPTQAAAPPASGIVGFFLHAARVTLFAATVILAVMIGRPGVQHMIQVAPRSWEQAATVTPAGAATAAVAQIKAVRQHVVEQPQLFNALIMTLAVFLLVNATVSFVEQSTSSASMQAATQHTSTSTSTSGDAAGPGAAAARSLPPPSTASASHQPGQEPAAARASTLEAAPRTIGGVGSAAAAATAALPSHAAARNGADARAPPPVIPSAAVAAALEHHVPAAAAAAASNGAGSSGASAHAHAPPAASHAHPVAAAAKPHPPAAEDPLKLAAAYAWALADKVNSKPHKPHDKPQ